jgi:hypothetical protein
MIRFLLVGLVWAVCVGGVALYMQARDAVRDAAVAAPGVAAPQTAVADYDLEVTLTFGAQADPFALTVADTEPTSAVTVRINDTLVAEVPEDVAPGVPWVQPDVEGVVLGSNELLVQATPPLDGASVRHAARVRVLEDGRAIADHTFWSEGGAKIIDTLLFQAAPEGIEDDHSH